MNLQRSVNHNIDLFAPAGAMNSNVRSFLPLVAYDSQPRAACLVQLKDMQKWVRFWLQRGQTPDGQTLLSKGAWRDILSLNMVRSHRFLALRQPSSLSVVVRLAHSTLRVSVCVPKFVGADSRVPNDAARQYMEFLKGFG